MNEGELTMISDNINAKAAAIDIEAQEFESGQRPDTPIADEVMQKGIQAILHGRPSAQWDTYMSLFAQPPDLDHLTTTDDPDPEREKARAYLVSNGICAMGTGKNLANNVGNRLD
jgi:hypothetical protein